MMKTGRAITVLTCLKGNVNEHGEADRALDKAIETLKADRWTPCSERLPSKEGEYLVTNNAGGVKNVEVDTLLHYEDSGEPFWCYSQNAIAWRELPVPFGEE